MCTEQPLVLELLALPLHPLVLLALVVCWGALRFARKRDMARSLACVMLILGATLGALSLGFALGGWLLGSAINPSPFLSLAPWTWALAAPVALWRSVGHACAAVAKGKRQSEPSPGFDALATIRARLAILYARWPPPAYTVKETGIFHLLRLLASFGDKATVRKMGKLDFWRTSRNPKPDNQLQVPR